MTMLAAIAALGLAAPMTADPVDRWRFPIAEASSRFGIPEEWIRRVMRAESGGRTHSGGRPTVSRAGAMGLMQVMPGTWRAMRAAHGLGSDPHQPRDNILAGTAYLRLMYDRFGYPGLFGAYNAGPARYAEHLATGRRLPAETWAYMAKLASTQPPRLVRLNVAARPSTGLFVIARAQAPAPFAPTPPDPPSSDVPDAAPPTAPLFVRLRGSRP